MPCRHSFCRYCCQALYHFPAFFARMQPVEKSFP
ncbi:MAG: hypothetical protein IKB58_04345 [Oscillospiraceae bacterium]|nr:hypothetical protein [Oscillospiraceae bacterium]MBR2929405.1 hypothetical protein [Oscillospiraceae bacterium]